MRKSVESLCGIVRTSHMNPLNGDAHVFPSKSRCLVHILHLVIIKAVAPQLSTLRYKLLLRFPSWHNIKI